jgi:hypothetical protein
MSITAKINMKKFQEIDLPLFTKGVEDIIGKKLEWNVDVPSFDHSYGQATFFEVEGVNESFEQYTFGPLRMVLSEFCANPDVKDMIMGVLKGINLSAQHPDGVMY